MHCIPLVIILIPCFSSPWCGAYPPLVCRQKFGRVKFRKDRVKMQIYVNPQSFSHELCTSARTYITRFAMNDRTNNHVPMNILPQEAALAAPVAALSGVLPSNFSFIWQCYHLWQVDCQLQVLRLVKCEVGPLFVALYWAIPLNRRTPPSEEC